eukprot:TRINITY_DN5486_c0_g2_i1.p1 TRINITY_DN5486_c0_g2~~TRINITY_DN5486_c0_g2_i1.p1  ORF type:complete len:215 (-),score=58.37 TRINITY_DN5486_c0_g2_i1:93-737(-)
MTSFEQIIAQLDRQYPLREWDEFFDLSRFKVPTKKNFFERLEFNLNHFAKNYVTLLILTYILAVYLKPYVLFSLAFCIGTWSYLFVYRVEPLIINNQIIQDNRKYSFILIGSLVLAIFFGGVILFYLLSISLLLILAHTIFRSRSIKNKLGAFVDNTQTQIKQVGLKEIVTSDMEKQNDNNTTTQSMHRQEVIQQIEISRQRREQVRQKYHLDG